MSKDKENGTTVFGENSPDMFGSLVHLEAISLLFKGDKTVEKEVSQIKEAVEKINSRGITIDISIKWNTALFKAQ